MAIQPLELGAEAPPPAHYVDWGAILGGAFVATAVAIVMFTFGAAIGLSMASPYDGAGASTPAYLVALGLWTIWIVASSFMSGGYIAGRLRRRVHDASEHESEVRDGAHGLIVWAFSIVVAAWLLTAGVTGVLGAATKAGAAAGGAAAAADNDRTGFTIDSLFRLPASAGAVTTTDTGAPQGVAFNVRAPANIANDRGEARRLLTYGMARGEMRAETKTALVDAVQRRTGMSRADAEQRVDQVAAEAKKAADIARKIGIILGFLTAAALLIGGAAAAWAANLGGRHRDQNTDTRAFWRWA